MSSNKAGLADLKRLAKQAAQQASSDAGQAVATSGANRSSGDGKGSGPTARAQQSVAPSAQDLALFRRLAGAVAPVDTRNRMLHSPATVLNETAASSASTLTGAHAKARESARPASASDQPRPDMGLSDADVSHLLCEDGTAFVRQGVGPDVLKKLAQRFWRLEADLDLHGMTIEQARPRLAAFITQCVAYDARCVRIVHGKGYGSPDSRPVLRDKVRAWLVGANDVRAFAQAPDRDGGAGATVVLLHIDDRRARDRRAP